MEELPDSEVFEGLRAMPPREIVEALHAWDCDPDLSVLVGAVTTLARTVEEQHTELARLNASLTAVARVAEQQQYATNPLGLIDRFDRHNEASPAPLPGNIEAWEQANYRTAFGRLEQVSGRLELVYLGLVDVWRMARPVVNDQREDIGNITRLHERTTALVAIEARCRAMLEAAGKLPDEPEKPPC